YTLVETQFEVESSNSGRQSTLTLGYLIEDMEEGDSVETKRYDHGDLVGYVSIVSEEVQDLKRIFSEAIESNSDQTKELVGLLEVAGCKGSLMLQLVEPPKISGSMILGNRRFFRRTDLATLGAEEGAMNLVGATKHPMVVGGEIFMRTEGIPRDEGEVQLVGSKWRMVPRSRFKWDMDLADDLE
ncbi:hypothetical protein L195_g050356, partial [Trifolium pratense]